MSGVPRQVYIKSADGSGTPRPVAGSVLPAVAPSDWTASGRILMQVSGDGTISQDSMDIFEIPATGGTPKVLLGGPSIQAQAVVSPNGRWVAYGSNESGGAQVFLTGADGTGGKWQVSTSGGNAPRWRNDSKEIVYIGRGPDGRQRLFAVTVEASGDSVSLGKPQFLFQASGPWSMAPDFSRVLVAVTQDSEKAASFVIVQNWTRLLK